MSVQSGMISEPPVNVNDSDHSAVTWLSIFFYSLRAGARVARFRRGKRKQQKRQELRRADAGALPGGKALRGGMETGSPLHGLRLGNGAKTQRLRDKGLLFWMGNKLFRKLPSQSGPMCFHFLCLFFFIFLLRWNLLHLELGAKNGWYGWKCLWVTNNNFHLTSTKSKLRLKIPLDVDVLYLSRVIFKIKCTVIWTRITTPATILTLSLNDLAFVHLGLGSANSVHSWVQLAAVWRCYKLSLDI